jgi:hypothetical protein
MTSDAEGKTQSNLKSNDHTSTKLLSAHVRKNPHRRTSGVVENSFDSPILIDHHTRDETKSQKHHKILIKHKKKAGSRLTGSKVYKRPRLIDRLTLSRPPESNQQPPKRSRGNPKLMKAHAKKEPINARSDVNVRQSTRNRDIRIIEPSGKSKQLPSITDMKSGGTKTDPQNVIIIIDDTIHSPNKKRGAAKGITTVVKSSESIIIPPVNEDSEKPAPRPRGRRARIIDCEAGPSQIRKKTYSSVKEDPIELLPFVTSSPWKSASKSLAKSTIRPPGTSDPGEKQTLKEKGALKKILKGQKLCESVREWFLDLSVRCPYSYCPFSPFEEVIPSDINGFISQNKGYHINLPPLGGKIDWKRTGSLIHQF